MKRAQSDLTDPRNALSRHLGRSLPCILEAICIVTWRYHLGSPSVWRCHWRTCKILDKLLAAHSQRLSRSDRARDDTCRPAMQNLVLSTIIAPACASRACATGLAPTNTSVPAHEQDVPGWESKPFESERAAPRSNGAGIAGRMEKRMPTCAGVGSGCASEGRPVGYHYDAAHRL